MFAVEAEAVDGVEMRAGVSPIQGSVAELVFSGEFQKVLYSGILPLGTPHQTGLGP